MKQTQAIYSLGLLLKDLHFLKGRGFLSRKIYNWLSVKNKQEFLTSSWKIRMKDQSLLSVPTNSTQSWTALFTGSYDEAEMNFISQFISENSVVLDVGACLGFYSVGLTQMNSKKSCQVIAFEPFKKNLVFLKENVKNNQLENHIKVCPFGLGDTSEEIMLSSAESGAGNAYIVEKENVPDFADELNSIQIRKLDEVVSELEVLTVKKCDLIKIDIEGFELRALNGAQDMLQKHRPVIFGEFDTFWMQHYGYDPLKDVLKWCQANRYRPHNLIEERKAFWKESELKMEELTLTSGRQGNSLILTPL